MLSLEAGGKQSHRCGGCAFIHFIFCHRAAALLAGAPVLGIDCEWQPALRADESQSAAPVAILQVAA